MTYEYFYFLNWDPPFQAQHANARKVCEKDWKNQEFIVQSQLAKNLVRILTTAQWSKGRKKIFWDPTSSNILYGTWLIFFFHAFTKNIKKLSCCVMSFKAFLWLFIVQTALNKVFYGKISSFLAVRDANSFGLVFLFSLLALLN